MGKKVKTTKKVKKNILKGIAHIHSSNNNTIITITDENGNALSWASAGTIGYKGSKKSTPYAAGIASETAAKNAMQFDLKAVKVYINGVGPGKDTAIRSLHATGLEITELNNVTPIPHNGCKAPRMPR